jgi:hypothetical protein
MADTPAVSDQWPNVRARRVGLLPFVLAAVCGAMPAVTIELFRKMTDSRTGRRADLMNPRSLKILIVGAGGRLN